MVITELQKKSLLAASLYSARQAKRVECTQMKTRWSCLSAVLLYAWLLAEEILDIPDWFIELLEMLRVAAVTVRHVLADILAFFIDIPLAVVRAILAVPAAVLKVHDPPPPALSYRIFLSEWQWGPDQLPSVLVSMWGVTASSRLLLEPCIWWLAFLDWLHIPCEVALSSVFCGGLGVPRIEAVECCCLPPSNIVY